MLVCSLARSLFGFARGTPGLASVERVRRAVRMEWLGTAFDEAAEIEAQRRDEEKMRKKEERRRAFLKAQEEMLAESGEDQSQRLTKAQKRLLRRKIRSETRTEKSRLRTETRRSTFETKDRLSSPEVFYFNGLSISVDR